MSEYYWKKWFKEQNLLYGFLTKYNGSINNLLLVNGNFHEQIFARDGAEELNWTEFLNGGSKWKLHDLTPFDHIKPLHYNNVWVYPACNEWGSWLGTFQSIDKNQSDMKYG